MAGDLNYCPRCANPLTLRPVEGRERLVCRACGFVYYLDPKLAVAVVVPYEAGVLLGRRAIDPSRGLWSFPSGYVERGEAVETAAVREVREETGLEVQLDGLVGLYSEEGQPVVVAVYAAHLIGGTLQAGPEMSELAAFRAEALPPMAFAHDGQIMRDWRELCARLGLSVPGSR